MSNASFLNLGTTWSAYRSSRPGFEGTSLQEFYEKFPTEQSCLKHLFQKRFGDDPVCHKCGTRGPWWWRRGHKFTQHRCGAILSPMANTIFHATKLPLQLWMYAMLHFANSNEGVNAIFLSRHLGITTANAFRMAQRIRLHLASLDEGKKLGSPNRPVVFRLETVLHIHSKTNIYRKKTRILCATDGQRVTAVVIHKPRRHHIRKAIGIMADKNSIKITDCHQTFLASSSWGIRKPTFLYKPAYFLENEHTSDRIQGFCNYFKPHFADNHRRISLQHLWLYIKESEFKYNRRYNSRNSFWDMLERFPEISPGSIHLMKKDFSLNTEDYC